jgi:molybdopterin-containing oxidoreductase family iron-sulfur binding subunit
MADHRRRIASGQATAFLAQLAVAAGVSGVPGLARLAAASPVDAAWVAACARDLLAPENRGAGLVMAGAHLPEAAHAIALLVNEALGSLGRTVALVAVDAPEAAGIGDVAAAIAAGQVETLVILGGNPCYDAPAELDWPALQARVPEVIRLGLHEDETSQGVAWHVAAAHYLESWGDARAADGTILPVQPMIEPLFGGLTDIEVLARILGEAAPDPHGQVQATLAATVGGGADHAFRQLLFDGFLVGSAWPRIAGSLDRAAAARAVEAAALPEAPTRERVEVRFVADLKVDDGRFANNGWLQECPDPVTKIAWDNAILVGPRLAAELGVLAPDAALQIVRKNPNLFEKGREVAPWGRVTIGSRFVEGPVHVQPGLDNYTVVLPLGYGRRVVGRVGRGAGFSAYAVRTSDAPWIAAGAKIEIVPGRTCALANTQEHWSMEGRAIVREANLEGPNGYLAQPDFVDRIGMESHTPPVYGPEGEGMPLAARVRQTPRGHSLYEHPNLDGVHQWGMSIDLTTCTGCNACVVACQAENNIPIVGRDQVRRGREMHWIRIDRYYADGGDSDRAFGGPGNAAVPEDPQVVVQPVGCLHCESAPCETVCPVTATVHDEEGLNVMAYNRCIGTRYCANNCPYKVRRFNFFDYNQRQLDQLHLGPLAPKGMPDLLQMAKNPDVTVRMRGVMEKCTYCVQRIQEAKIRRKAQARDSAGVKIPDGSFKVACEQACPTAAIVFGDVSDPESAVSKAKAADRDYELLGYLNVRPRTTYAGRLRNPNPAMPDFHDLPLSRREYDAKSGHGAAHGGPPAGEHAPAH